MVLRVGSFPRAEVHARSVGALGVGEAERASANDNHHQPAHLILQKRAAPCYDSAGPTGACAGPRASSSSSSSVRLGRRGGGNVAPFRRLERGCSVTYRSRSLHGDYPAKVIHAREDGTVDLSLADGALELTRVVVLDRERIQPGTCAP
jgi:hypothetical protein